MANIFAKMADEYFKDSEADIFLRHTFEETEIGVTQGRPLSPLLNNIMLNMDITERVTNALRGTESKTRIIDIDCCSRRSYPK
jgi:retron-type reverse transcriptase